MWIINLYFPCPGHILGSAAKWCMLGIAKCCGSCEGIMMCINQKWPWDTHPYRAITSPHGPNPPLGSWGRGGISKCSLIECCIDINKNRIPIEHPISNTPLENITQCTGHTAPWCGIYALPMTKDSSDKKAKGKRFCVCNLWVDRQLSGEHFNEIDD